MVRLSPGEPPSHAHGSAQGLPHRGGGEEGGEGLLLVFPIMLEGHLKVISTRCGYLRCLVSGLGTESLTCRCSAGNQHLVVSLCVSAGTADQPWPPGVTLQQFTGTACVGRGQPRSGMSKGVCFSPSLPDLPCFVCIEGQFSLT